MRQLTRRWTSSFHQQAGSICSQFVVNYAQVYQWNTDSTWLNVLNYYIVYAHVTCALTLGCPLGDIHKVSESISVH